MLCYVMLCYAMLYYTMLCYVILYYIIILYYIMGPSSYMRSVVDRNVVMRRMTINSTSVAEMRMVCVERKATVSRLICSSCHIRPREPSSCSRRWKVTVKYRSLPTTVQEMVSCGVAARLAEMGRNPIIKKNSILGQLE